MIYSVADSIKMLIHQIKKRLIQFNNHKYQQIKQLIMTENFMFIDNACNLVIVSMSIDFLKIIYNFYYMKKNSQLSMKDEQGFHNAHLEIKTQEESKQYQEILIKIPSAKQLIRIQRPLDYHPRILSKDPPMKQLPIQTEQNSNQTYFEIPDSQQIVKKIPSGKGKALYNYFQPSSLFKCIYQKNKSFRTEEEIAYDFTAKNKMLEFSNDYDERMYKKLEIPTINEDSQNGMKEQFEFFSHFESGNLSHVFQNVLTQQYYLLTQNDCNTHGYNHWFFFEIKNKKRKTICLHLVNMIKKTAMYKHGMKISIFSSKMNQKYGKKWFKGGQNISYYNSKIERTNKENQSYYNLSFTYTFLEQNDSVYFALNNPYTYTKLIHYLTAMEQKMINQEIYFQRKCVGYSLANNAIPAVTISASNQHNRKVLLFLARQHPGETVGSFVCEGVLEFFTEKTFQANFLLNKFRIVIIPMINPDGVIYGNSRCNLSGLDLNRQWGDNILKELTPQTFSIKKYIKFLEEQYGIECMIDLHGHSKKMNSFFYASKKENKVNMRILSALMSKIEPNFQLFSCMYGLTKDKINTVRAQLFKLGINSITLENSYFGSDRNNIKLQYTDKDLKNIGKSLIKSLFISFCPETQSIKLYNISKNKIAQQIQLNLQEYEQEQLKNKNDSGSQSDPDGDILAYEERVKTFQIKDSVKQKSIINSISQLTKKKKYENPLMKQFKISQKEVMIIQNEFTKYQKKQKSEKILKVAKEIQIHDMLEKDIVKKPLTFQKKRPTTRIKRIERAFKNEQQKDTIKLQFEKNLQKQEKYVSRKTLQSQKHKQNNTPLQQIEHMQRKKTLVREPLKFRKTQSKIFEKYEKPSRLKKFYTQIDDLKDKIEKKQDLLLQQLQKKQKHLQGNEFIRIESFIHKKPDKELTSYYIDLAHKISKQKTKSNNLIKHNRVSSNLSKYCKFESFLSQTDNLPKPPSKYLSTKAGIKNSIFYNFTVL